MKRFLTNVLALGILSCAFCVVFIAKAAYASADDDAVRESDRSFVAALGKSDKAAAGKLLDTDFTWTNSAGDTIARAKVMANLPKDTLGDESGAQVSEHTYGRTAAVQAASGHVHIVRIWVKRPAGWRLLDYQEVKQAEHAGPGGGPTTNNCENPCKGVPYRPRNAAEKGILASWGQLETAVLHHDSKAWSPHFLDEFVLITSGGTEPITKQGRMALLNKPGIGPAPPQLAKTPAVRFFVFGDSAVMIAQANPYAGKPTHISRIWVNQDGIWKMAFSYQTTIQSAAVIVPLAP